MQNFTNYQIIFMLQNIDNLHFDVLQIKEHVKKMHIEYSEIVELKEKHSQELNDINSNLGIITKSLGYLKDALAKPSPPDYRKIDKSNYKLKFPQTSNQPKGLRSLFFKNFSQNNDLEKIQSGIKLAMDKIILMRSKVEKISSILRNFKVDQLTKDTILPNNYVKLSDLYKKQKDMFPNFFGGEEAKGETSNTKRDKNDTFYFSNKSPKKENDQYEKDIPFKKYASNMADIPSQNENTRKGF